MSQYSDLKDKMTEMKTQMKELGKAEFTKVVAELFEKRPGLESFGWRQYTPYFNDGDTCVFGVSNDPDNVEVNEVSGYDLPMDRTYTWNGPQIEKDAYYAERKEKLWLHEEVSELLKCFDDNTMMDIFGDHAQLTFYRDGTHESVEYDHD